MVRSSVVDKVYLHFQPLPPLFFKAGPSQLIDRGHQALNDQYWLCGKGVMTFLLMVWLSVVDKVYLHFQPLPPLVFKAGHSQLINGAPQALNDQFWLCGKGVMTFFLMVRSSVVDKVYLHFQPLPPLFFKACPSQLINRGPQALDDQYWLCGKGVMTFLLMVRSSVVDKVYLHFQPLPPLFFKAGPSQLIDRGHQALNDQYWLCGKRVMTFLLMVRLSVVNKVYLHFQPLPPIVFKAGHSQLINGAPQALNDQFWLCGKGVMTTSCFPQSQYWSTKAQGGPYIN